MPKLRKSLVIPNDDVIKMWLKLDLLEQKIKKSWIEIKT